MSDTFTALFKQALYLVVKYTPFLILFSGLTIWFYLSHIGRINIFPEILSSYSSFISILASLFFIGTAFSITFILPSLVLILLHLTLNQKDNFKYIKKTPVVSTFISCAFIAILLSISAYNVSYKKDVSFDITWITVTSASLLYAIINIGINYTYIKRKSLTKNTLCFIGITMTVTFFMSISSLSISFPMLLILSKVSADNAISSFFLSVILLTFTFFCFIPASIYYRQFDNKLIKPEKNEVSLMITSIPLVVFFLVCMLIPGLSVSIIHLSLNTLGFSDSQTHYYYINNKKYTSDMFNKDDWNPVTQGTFGKKLYIKGVSLFSMSGKKLICPEYTHKLQIETYKTDLYKQHFELDKDKMKQLKAATQNCILFNNDDIQQWDTLFDDNGKIKGTE
ncbi:hypothetical protein [Morganella morganii]|uniref:hypothetical protein n=1 Tax=Morganella morganii TaxID=582 RepID=UPI0031B1A312